MFTSVNIVLAFTAIEIVNSVDIGRITAARQGLIVNVSPVTSAAPRFEVLKKNTPDAQTFRKRRRPKPRPPPQPQTTTKSRPATKLDIPDIPYILEEDNEELAGNIQPNKVNDAQGNIGQQWPLGVVPYIIDSKVYDKPTVKRIQKMMSVIESSSCVVFNELDSKSGNTDSGWLHITNPTQERECVHEYSQGSSGDINVVLGFECLYPNEILHSLLHAIGFKDEVSHPHRDQYIRILWENIQPSYRQLFRIQYDVAPFKLVEYDPMSIMHFHDRAYTVNGAATIAPLAPGLQINPGTTLSSLDVMKLKLAFGHECKKRKVDDLLDTCKVALLSKDTHINDESNDDPEHSLENASLHNETIPQVGDSGSGDKNTDIQTNKDAGEYGDNDNPEANFPTDDNNQSAEGVDTNDQNDGIHVSAEIVTDDVGGGIEDNPGGGIDDNPGGGIEDVTGGDVEDNNVASDG